MSRSPNECHCGAAAAALAALVYCCAAPVAAAGPRPPNVVLILADDVGYGDLGCYGATQVATPNLDRLAREGRRFTDTHTASSVCTPSRYALLTGCYAWRHRPAAGILNGIAGLSIEPDRLTLPAVFKAAGYSTAAIGKWHLGLGSEPTDYNGEIAPGPLEVGFDYFFGIPATGDRTPCVYIENHRVAGLDPADPIRVSYSAPLLDEPTGREHPELLRIRPSHGHDQTIVGGISRIGYMSGGRAARWNDADMADVLVGKSVELIERIGPRPFFLYFATHDIHVPRVPHPRFAGRSPHGTRGDAIAQLDASVGAILAALDKQQLADDTLVIFTSDNGGVMDDGYQDGSATDTSGHRCNGSLRGFKGSLFEGGHRVPFLVRWPSRVPHGESEQSLVLVDLLASFAAMTGQKLGEKDGPDSLNALPALLGESNDPVRDHLIHHSGGFPGNLAIRLGPWKLLEAGGENYAGRAAKQPLLFNLQDDPAEMHDLAAEMPEKVAQLKGALNRARLVSKTRTPP